MRQINMESKNEDFYGKEFSNVKELISEQVKREPWRFQDPVEKDSEEIGAEKKCREHYFPMMDKFGNMIFRSEIEEYKKNPLFEISEEYKWRNTLQFLKLRFN